MYKQKKISINASNINIKGGTMYPIVIFLNSGLHYMESIYEKIGFYIPITSVELSMSIDQCSIDKGRIYIFHGQFLHRKDLLLELQYVLAILEKLATKQVRILSPGESVLKRYEEKITLPHTFQRLFPEEEKRRKSLAAWTEK